MSKILPLVMLMIWFLCGCWVIQGPSGDEVTPPDTRPCFPGAYYRKAVSSMDRWTGIEGIVTLPEITFDPARFDEQRGRYLDNPSIYMGGHAEGQEIDAGLTWEIIREPDGSVSKLAKAFRPFWRNDQWHNAPAQPQYYYYPGDTIYMRAEAIEPDQMELEVSLLSRGGNAPAGSPISSTFTVTFDAPGFGDGGLQEFKRVNAIDQVGNEGVDVTATLTRVENAAWEEVYLLRGDERRAMTTVRYTGMLCPHEKFFDIDSGGFHNLSGEVITIDGSRVDGGTPGE